MIKHHVKEEEKAGGMFAEARKSTMDLSELGARLLDQINAILERESPAIDAIRRRCQVPLEPASAPAAARNVAARDE
jgi:hypothetical protein